MNQEHTNRRSQGHLQSLRGRLGGCWTGKDYFRDRVTGSSDTTSQTICLSQENEHRLLLGHINPRAGRMQLKAALPPEHRRHKSPNMHSFDFRNLSMLVNQGGRRQTTQREEGKRAERIAAKLLCSSLTGLLRICGAVLPRKYSEPRNDSSRTFLHYATKQT